MSNNNFASLKIKRNHKILFDELAYQNRSNQWQFLERLLEHWCKTNDKETYELYLKNELPE